MDDDIRTQELSGAPVSESDAPTGEEPADEPGEERRHSEQAFREDEIEAEAEKTIDNPALAEVDLAQEEGGNTPLVDEWSGGGRRRRGRGGRDARRARRAARATRWPRATPSRGSPSRSERAPTSATSPSRRPIPGSGR